MSEVIRDFVMNAVVQMSDAEKPLPAGTHTVQRLCMSDLRFASDSSALIGEFGRLAGMLKSFVGKIIDKVEIVNIKCPDVDSPDFDPFGDRIRLQVTIK